MDMKQIRKQNILEQSIYWTLWLIVFLTPMLGNLLAEKNSANHLLSWDMIGKGWLRILPFFVLFLANNYVLVPHLFMQKKYLHYIILVFILIGGLDTYNRHSRHEHHFHENRLKEIEMQNRALPFNSPPAYPLQAHHQYKSLRCPDFPANEDEQAMNANRRYSNSPQPEDKDFAEYEKGQMDRIPPSDIRQDFKMKGPPNFPKILFTLIYSLIAILMVGFNIAIRLIFQSFRDEERMKELEKEKLKTELQYLKYQMNPHFFMNTLNNIHALVDINTEEARSSIIELSKLMRYVLYEANNSMISLAKELQFQDNYVNLMKLRFINKVHIEIDIPKSIPDVQVPPLLFITFIENAFKHGISYQKDSFIKLKLQIDETNNKIIFYSSNSNWKKVEDQHHGIGLDNVKKRLNLIYGRDFTLSINNDKEKNIFDVLLIIPLRR
jgi:hypothetical protein